MFAKLYFESSWICTTDILPVLASVLTGETNVNAVAGATARFIPSMSYILTNKNTSGWSVEGSSSTVRVLSAPCKDSTKKKFARISSTSNTMSLQLGEGFAGTNLTGQVTTDGPNQDAHIIFNGSSTYPHNANAPVEVWVSSSPRHFLIAVNQPGYAHGTGIADGRNGGWVVGIVEHANSDSWLTDSSSYIPACIMTSQGADTSLGNASLTFFRNRSRNIAVPTVTDFANNVDSSKLYAYTKYGSGTLSNITLGGTNLVQSDENTAVKSLLPFGARNKAALVRGGAISDLCDIYLAPASIFNENLQIQVGENTANRYHIWNLGFTSNNALSNYNLAVPRG